jgi:uncharacterized protein YggU (UPF0235/DUF167 family)
MMITVYVKTGKAFECVIPMQDGSFEIHTTKRPHDNEANCAVVELIAEAFGLPKGSITIRRGLKSRLKHVCVDGLQEEALSRLFKDRNCRDHRP